MIRTACPSPDRHQGFLKMLPIIVIHAKTCFRYLRPEGRAEAVQQVVANCCRAFARLVELGKTSVADPNALARFRIKQGKDHRKVGGRLTIGEVLVAYCQTRKGVVVERLDHHDEKENCCAEAVVEDKTTGPAEIARMRIDFHACWHQLPRRKRCIAEFLSRGNRTSDAARKFRLSPGRICQLRKELAENWKTFLGDEPGDAAVLAQQLRPKFRYLPSLGGVARDEKPRCSFATGKRTTVVLRGAAPCPRFWQWQQTEGTLGAHPRTLPESLPRLRLPRQPLARLPAARGLVADSGNSAHGGTPGHAPSSARSGRHSSTASDLPHPGMPHCNTAPGDSRA